MSVRVEAVCSPWLAVRASTLRMDTDNPTDKKPALELPPDIIRIDGLRLETRIGVPEDERRTPQTVEVFLSIHPSSISLCGLSDDLEHTIDYFEVSRRVIELASRGERRLIETLAENIAELVLKHFPARAVTVEVRKFILPETNFVSVFLSKCRETIAL